PFDGADLGAIELEADSVACDRVVGDDLGAEFLQGLMQAGLLLFGEVLEALFDPFAFGLVEACSGCDFLRRHGAEGTGCAGQRPAISCAKASEALFDSPPSMSCQCRRLVFRPCFRHRGRWYTPQGAAHDGRSEQ